MLACLLDHVCASAQGRAAWKSALMTNPPLRFHSASHRGADLRATSREAALMPGPPLHSLVKYDTPSLLTTKGKAGAKKGAAPAKGGKKQLPPVEAKPQVTQTEDILNSILPPR